MDPIQNLRDTLSDVEFAYSEALDRGDYTAAFRLFGDIEALRQELDFALEDDSDMPDSLDCIADDYVFEGE